MEKITKVRERRTEKAATALDLQQVRSIIKYAEQVMAHHAIRANELKREDAELYERAYFALRDVCIKHGIGREDLQNVF